jgi:hypothetical protein
MKQKAKISLLFILTVLIAIIGNRIASALFRDYKIIVDGLMGLLIFDFAYQLYFSSKKIAGQKGNMFLRLHDDYVKNLVPVFLWSMIAYWALKQVIAVVLWVIDIK